ncbi:MAG: WD40 repeat domain-containing protein [Chloroflexi bacterium]|nr:WD40 repeat domain-containing protein [Chloroflexota bacterium]
MKNKAFFGAIFLAIGCICLVNIGSGRSFNQYSYANDSTPTSAPTLFLPLITADNVRDIRELMNFNLNQNVNAIWSPKDSLLAIYAEQGVQIIDIADKNIIFPFFEASAATTSVLFSPDGQILAQATSDGGIHLWDLTANTEKRVLVGHEFGISAMAFSLDGKLLASADFEGNTIVWDMETYEQINQFEHAPPNSIEDLAFSPDGNVLAIAAIFGGIQMKDLTTGERFNNELTDDGITALAFSPDGKYLAYGQPTGVIRVWGEDGWKTSLALLRSHRGKITNLVFSPNSDLLVSASEDGTVRIWETSTGNELMVLQSHNGLINDISFGLQGSVISSAGQDGLVILWAIPQ